MLLIFSGYLYIVTGVGLTVVHCVLLHVHERGIRISLAVTISIAEYLKMFVVLI